MKIVRVPLRISLVGGGSDIPSHYEEHGGAVVSFTIDKYIFITAKRNTSLFPHKYRLVYSTVEECNDRSEIKHPIIRQLINDYGIGALDLDVMSDIPAGTGMGSSSAFTVGLHAALGDVQDKHLLAEAACHTELYELQEPIGKQDQYATAFGGLNYIEFDENRVNVTPLLLKSPERGLLENSMHLVYLGGHRNAGQQLVSQAGKFNSKILRDMSAVADELHADLLGGKFSDLGTCVKENWLLKKQLSPNVSNDKIDAIISKALLHGATGGKLLGAGGTGFVLLVCPPEHRAKMLRGLCPLNLTYVAFRLDYEGVKTLYEG